MQYLSHLIQASFFYPLHMTHNQRLINLQIWKCPQTDHLFKITSFTFVRKLSIKELTADLADPTSI